MAWEYDPAKMAAEVEETSEERIARSDRTVVVVHPGRSKMHKRRAIKNVGAGASYEVEWLVAHLNGVNVFVHEKNGQTTIVISERDLKP